ncbi:MAG: septum formation family protein [Actinomycetota bacterium]|nr:septum formation family protein [Actinomycetota bacterium]
MASSGAGRPVVRRGRVVAVLALCGALGFAAAGAVALRGDSPGHAGTGSVGAYSLRAGDCFHAPEQGQVRRIERVGCDAPHDAEVLAVQSLPAGPWPGQAELDNGVEVRCAGELRSYVGIEPVDSELSVTWFAPTQDGWVSGDRSLTCVAISDKPLTGSARGSRR